MGRRSPRAAAHTTTWRGSRAGLSIALVVLALHALLALGWWSSLRPPMSGDTTPRGVATSPAVIYLPWVQPAPPSRTRNADASTQEAVVRAAPAPSRDARPRAPDAAPPRREPPSTVAPDVITLPITEPPVAQTPRAAASEPAAARADASGVTTQDLLRNDATRRALREAARSPGVATLSNEALGAEPPSDSERLGREVARGAKGDCLKGEYVGGNMGLLSLPFLAAAAMRGDCQR